MGHKSNKEKVSVSLQNHMPWQQVMAGTENFLLNNSPCILHGLHELLSDVCPAIFSHETLVSSL